MNYKYLHLKSGNARQERVLSLCQSETRFHTQSLAMLVNALVDPHPLPLELISSAKLNSFNLISIEITSHLLRYY